ncbi:MAG TPA: hypothetical protein DD685_04295 [Halomonas sp.]|nr:hypothetical protein [Halomonas sp.]|tara:strand:+ start:9308 stop:9946 length:639 start_codon:yes stop_codon:yes gene_type:complete
MSAVFQYNEEKAVAADSGGGEYITESCVVRGFIEQAKWVEANSGAKGLELTFESENGQKANYLTLYYQKRDGSQNEVGHQQIQSLMGCTGAQSLTQAQGKDGLIAPELTRKPVQVALERENYIKGNGEEGFRFQIKCFMSARSGLTIAEHKAGKQAESAGYWAERFAKNPKGAPPKQQTQNTQNYGGDPRQHVDSFSYGTPGSDQMDDEIPF